MEYTIVRGDAPAVVAEVNEKLNEGWELFGNLVAVTQHLPDAPSSEEYGQAMIRQSAEERKPGAVRIGHFSM